MKFIFPKSVRSLFSCLPNVFGKTKQIDRNDSISKQQKVAGPRRRIYTQSASGVIPFVNFGRAKMDNFGSERRGFREESAAEPDSEGSSSSVPDIKIVNLENNKNELGETLNKLILSKQIAEEILTSTQKNLKSVPEDDPRYISQKETSDLIENWKTRINGIGESIENIKYQLKDVNDSLNFVKSENIQTGTQ